jgi:uncharacterized protein (DUF924 family)
MAIRAGGISYQGKIFARAAIGALTALSDFSTQDGATAAELTRSDVTMQSERRGISMMQMADDVLRFWFPKESLRTEPADLLRQVEWWFRGGADADIIKEFSSLLEQAERGELDAWAGSPRSRLALINVFDQFSRSIYRGTARAYANDPKALALAREGIEIGHAAALKNPWEQIFFGLPLGHSEDLASQELSVKLIEQLVLEAPPEFRVMLEFSAEQARGHRPFRSSSPSQRGVRTMLYARRTRLPCAQPTHSHAAAAHSSTLATK